MDSTISSISTSAPVGTRTGKRVKESHRNLVSNAGSCNKSAKTSAAEKMQLAASRQARMIQSWGAALSHTVKPAEQHPVTQGTVFTQAVFRTAPLTQQQQH
jgi:ureidoglycolate hydrolase